MRRILATFVFCTLLYQFPVQASETEVGTTIHAAVFAEEAPTALLSYHLTAQTLGFSLLQVGSETLAPMDLQLYISPTPGPVSVKDTLPGPTVEENTMHLHRYWWPRPNPTPVISPEPTPEPTPQPTPEPTPVPTPLPTPIPTPTPYVPGKVKLPPLSRQVVLRINKQTQRMEVIDGGKLIASFPVSTGLGPLDTPTGTFKILAKVAFPSYAGSPHMGKRYWAPKDPHNPLGTRWMQISAWHYRSRAMLGIHGTDEPFGIGKAVSGGCIRMFNADVETLFSVVPVGVRVLIEDPRTLAKKQP